MFYCEETDTEFEVVHHYCGEVLSNGVPHGFGIKDNRTDVIYCGSFVNGKMDGRGIILVKSGKVYRATEGEFKADKPYNCKQIDENGEVISQWIDGEEIVVRPKRD